ncbi:MAG: SBBP repeat-containing protein, partial [Bacteroidia bacterium]
MKKIGLLFTVVFYAMVGYAQLPVTNWQNTFGNASGNARVTATATDANGNVYVAGYFFGSVDMDFGAGQANITSSGQYDAFIAKYNAFGDFTWVRRIGGTQGDQVNAIFLDNSGGLHVTGFFQGTTSIFASNGTFNLTSVGGADIFMLYFDGAGTLIRNFRIGGTGDESGLAIKADINSNVYLAGTIGSANVNFNVYGGSQLISSSGALDGFIAKYDFSYAAQWVQRVGGGTVDDAINDLDVDASGNAYVVGTYRGAA